MSAAAFARHFRQHGLCHARNRWRLSAAGWDMEPAVNNLEGHQSWRYAVFRSFAPTPYGVGTVKHRTGTEFSTSHGACRPDKAYKQVFTIVYVVYLAGYDGKLHHPQGDRPRLPHSPPGKVVSAMMAHSWCPAGCFAAIRPTRAGNRGRSLVPAMTHDLARRPVARQPPRSTCADAPFSRG